ncbi:MAG TPA: ABC transporter ATP-binding protein [Negativicutes bacterium]|nr:ABC transporter ATP-binding protein [Negativicutes bacterium]
MQLENVSLAYPGQNPEHPSLQDITLDIEEGEFVAVVGPSGGGKSSVINLLAGLVAPTGGQILLHGRPLTGPGPDRAVVFQDYSLFPWMTALQNIAFALKQVGGASRERARKLLEVVGLSDAAAKYPSQLSGGMRQRVAIARAFALGAPVYLMDEPFGAVDAKNRIYLQDLLLRLWTEEKQKKTIFLVTHDIDEALYLADRVVVFTPSPGRIRRIIPVPFSRPRHRSHLLRDETYIGLRNDILSLLQAELIEEFEAVEGGEGI